MIQELVGRDEVVLLTLYPFQAITIHFNYFSCDWILKNYLDNVEELDDKQLLITIELEEIK